MAEFECRLKTYRQLKDPTQEQLANLVGVRRETIARLEKARYAVDGKTGRPLEPRALKPAPPRSRAPHPRDMPPALRRRRTPRTGARRPRP